jgi:hypothetical protein
MTPIYTDITARADAFVGHLDKLCPTGPIDDDMLTRAISDALHAGVLPAPDSPGHWEVLAAIGQRIASRLAPGALG